MITYGVTAIQNKPSLLKEMVLGEIVDKRAHKKLIQTIEQEEKMAKLNRLKHHQDIDFLELGVDDGL